MRCKFIIYLAIAGVMFAGRPVIAADDLPLDEDQALMELYFGDEPSVEVATHVATPVSRIAENVTVINRAEIEAMHAHSVKEILRSVAGVRMDFDGYDLAGSGNISIHNSDVEHVLVLLDGVRWSFIDSDWNDTVAIPVGIIDRIEVIKGAASSSWGSSMGGVINIITRKAGISSTPSGSLQATAGSRADTHTVNGEMAGKVNRFGYFLHAGSLHTDGLVSETYGRARDHETYYGKLSLDLPHGTTLSSTVGRFDPYWVRSSRELWNGSGIYPMNEDDFFYSLRLDSRLAASLVAHLEYQDFAREYSQPGWSGTGSVRNHSLQGVSGYLAWSNTTHALVAGGEHSRNHYHDLGTPGKVYDEFWGLYINDTISLGNWTVIPGVRYDNNLNADNQVSPSLGATCRLSAQTLLRAGVASGFRRPPSAIKTYSPDLQPSKSWSYQAGVESTALQYATLKLTAFQHRMRDSWVWDNVNFLYYNSGKVVNNGLEFEVETASWQNLSCKANYTFVDTRYLNGSAESDSQNLANLIFRYDSVAWTARLSGHYEWVGVDRKQNSAKLDTPLWDITVTRHLAGPGRTSVDLFASGHNLFDGSQYLREDYQNAGRWLEVGVKLLF